MFSVLFVLGLLALHWREKDEAAVQALRPVPAPANVRGQVVSGP